MTLQRRYLVHHQLRVVAHLRFLVVQSVGTCVLNFYLSLTTSSSVIMVRIAHHEFHIEQFLVAVYRRERAISGKQKAVGQRHDALACSSEYEVPIQVHLMQHRPATFCMNAL